ncbi:helix-turn-helix domain-containing protein [Streptomyces sp. NPDC005336]|uniref:helix-turn-helix domain-containing protein n=1 Tax=unclassified Streptomyces TaxID=2593676 RepID=UPI0033AF109C
MWVAQEETVDVQASRERALTVYAAALRDTAWRPEGIQAAEGWTESDITSAIDWLVDMGLLVRTSTTASGWLALPPEGAMGNLLLDTYQDLAYLLDRTRHTRESLPLVLTEFQAVHSRHQSEARLQLVTGEEQVKAALEGALHSARREIVAMHTERPRTHAFNEPYLLALQRGLSVRSIHLDSSAAIPTVSGYLHQLSALGGEVHTAATLPLQLSVIDQGLILLPATDDLLPNGEGTGLVVLRSSVLGVVLHELFAHCWTNSSLLLPPLLEQMNTGVKPQDRAEPATYSSRQRDTQSLRQRHQALLRMLAAGMTDEAIGRKLGVHVRTVRRRVSDLAAALGADSRFQAGVNAERAGWLGEPD